MVNGKTEIVEYLITKHQCDPQHGNNDGLQPLHWACKNGHMDTVKYLIEQQHCDPAYPSNFLKTPLYLAVQNDHFHITHYIFSKNLCKLTAKLDQNQNTILHLAANRGHLDTIKLLSKLEGFDVTVENINGSHPLHFACRSGHVDVVEYLLSNRRTVATHCNRHGLTPMMLAAEHYERRQLLNVFAVFGHSKSSIPIDEFVKVGILGHPRAGKTTLSQCYC